MSDLVADCLGAQYPAVALYKSLQIDDERRLDAARAIAERPRDVALAFARTSQAIAGYENPQPFYDTPRAAYDLSQRAGKLEKTEDVAFRLAPTGTWINVRGASTHGLKHGDLDLMYLDRELSILRTTKSAQAAGVMKPAADLQPDLLLAGVDGSIVVGEIKVDADRDLFYALIQSLACVSLLATPAQIQRIRDQYGHSIGPRFDIVLFATARRASTYLKDLDALAPTLAAGLLLDPGLSAVLRRVVCVDATLDDEDALSVSARWVKQAPGWRPPSAEQQVFDVDSIGAVRRAAEDATRLDDDGPNGWALSPHRPAAIIDAIPGLALRSGLELQGYEYRHDDNGNGLVWAVPAGTAPPELNPGPFLDQRPIYPVDPVPQPEGAAPAMSAVTGDGTAWSYVCASIAARELAEFGARWHGCSWSDEAILGAAPWEMDPPPDWPGFSAQPKESWTITAALPHDWSPSVQVQDGVIVVLLHTYSGLGREAIIKNTDRYTPGSYVPAMEFEELAHGPGGFVY